MNLINKIKVSQDSSVQSKILEVLREAGVSEKNLQIALKFTDFSKDMDLTILEDIEHNDLKDKDLDYHVKSLSMDIFKQSSLKVKTEYVDRYVLLLDAIGGNTIGDLVHFNYRDIDSMYTDRTEQYYHLLRAYNRRYTTKETTAKFMSLITETITPPTRIDIELLENMAKTEPETLYFAAENYCFGKYSNTIVKLAAHILAYTKPEEVLDDKKKKCVETCVQDILDSISCSDLKNTNLIKFFSVLCMMGMHHSDKLKDFVKEHLTNNEKNIIDAILINMPLSYFKENFYDIFELFDFDNKPKEVLFQCIKLCISKYGQKSYFEKRVPTILRYFAEKYEKEFIEIMYLDNGIAKHNSNDNENSLWYYPEMYNILKEYNKNAIKKYNIDYVNDLVDLGAKTISRRCGSAKYAVQLYLNGNKDFSSLEPYYKNLDKNYTPPKSYQERGFIETCIKTSKDFKKRYFSFLTLVDCYRINSMMNNNKNNINKNLDEVIDYIIEEKVPIEYRFDFYNAFLNYNSNYIIEENIADRMVLLSDVYSDDYKLLEISDNIHTKRIYLLYLGKMFDKDVEKQDETKKIIFSMCSDRSILVRDRATEVISKHKEYEKDVLELLASKKMAVREVGVDVLNVWGINDNYREILEKAVEKEKSVKLANKINELLCKETTNLNHTIVSTGIITAESIVKNMHKGGKVRKIGWLYEKPFSPVHFTNGSVAEDRYLQAILICFANMENLGLNSEVNILTENLDKTELGNFAMEVYSKWINKGAEAKKRWVLYFVSICGNQNMIDILLAQIKDWSEKSRGAIAADAVMAIALNGSSYALMAVDNMAHKFKHKQVKNAAINALENAAKEMGITSEELGDKIVPNLGFDENMERIFDYGTRKFKVYINPSLELEVYDENDKKLKNMPAPAKKDIEDIAKASNSEFKQMKKQLKNVISIQKSRLETALMANRKWKVADWENLFVKNPIMHNFAIGLIWCSFDDNGNIQQTFRYMEDGSFNTAEEDEYILPDDCKIGLAHPVELDEETISSWKEQLDDYEIVQPIQQLERKVYKVNDDELGKIDLMRFNNRNVNGLTLLGRMSKFGWQKGSVQDAGCFSTFFREDITKRITRSDNFVKLFGNAVELHFSGMYVAGGDEYVTIENIRFYNPGNVKHGSYVYDEVDKKKAIKLENVPPRYFSEVIAQLEEITK